MNISVNSQEGPRTYQMGGKTRLLAPDGALEHEIWDQLTVGADQETRDQYVKTLYDSRLGESQPTLESLGSQWKMAPSTNFKKCFVLGDPEGMHQSVEISTAGRSGNEFKVTTHLPGVADHQMRGRNSFSGLNTEYITEEIVLP